MRCAFRTSSSRRASANVAPFGTPSVPSRGGRPGGRFVGRRSAATFAATQSRAAALSSRPSGRNGHPLPDVLGHPRGGSFFDGIGAGVFKVEARGIPSTSGAIVGFRCAR